MANSWFSVPLAAPYIHRHFCSLKISGFRSGTLVMIFYIVRFAYAIACDLAERTWGGLLFKQVICLFVFCFFFWDARNSCRRRQKRMVWVMWLEAATQKVKPSRFFSVVDLWPLLLVKHDKEEKFSSYNISCLKIDVK